MRCCCGQVPNVSILKGASVLNISPWVVSGAIAVAIWLSVSHMPVLALAVNACRAPDGATAAQHTLTPEGAVTADGLMVAAPPSSLTKPVTLSIDTVADPRPKIPFPEFLEHALVISDFYSLTADQEVQPSGSTYLLLGLELPDEVPPGQLGIAVLAPPESVLGFLPDDDPSRRWDFLTGVVDPDSGFYGVALTSLTTEPQVFVLTVQP